MKYLSIGRRMILLMAVVFASPIFCSFSSKAAQGEEMEKVDLLVLLDTSGSMIDSSKSWDTALEWTMDIGAFSLGTGVALHIVGFDDPVEKQSEWEEKEIYDGKIDSFSDLERFQKIISSVYANGKYTDHKGALEYAEELLEHEGNTCQCILMLSDGDLDYPEIDDAEEAAAVKDFQNNVKDFANKTNKSIVLVGFGNQKEMLESSAHDNQALYFDGNENREKVLKSIFERLNYPIEYIIESSPENPLEFEVDAGCYRVIANVRSVDSNNMSLQPDDILLTVGKEAKEVSFSLAPLTSSAYLYIEAPIAGDYTLTLPSGKWNSSIECQRYRIPDSIEVELLQDKIIIEKNEQGVYRVDKNSPCEIRLSGNNLDLSEMKLTYACWPEGTTDTEIKFVELQLGDVQNRTAPIEVPENEGRYLFQVRCSQAGVSKESVLTIIEVFGESEPDATPASETILLKLEEKYCLTEYKDMADQYILCINDDKMNTCKLNRKLDNEYVEYSGSDGYALSFKMEGDYELEIRNIDTGDVYFRALMDVEGDKERENRGFWDWIKKIMDWFSGK